MYCTAANGIPTSPLSQVREQITDLCINILHSYRKFCATVSSSGQLILPEALKFLPLYTLGMSLLFCNGSWFICYFIFTFRSSGLNFFGWYAVCLVICLCAWVCVYTCGPVSMHVGAGLSVPIFIVYVSASVFLHAWMLVHVCVWACTSWAVNFLITHLSVLWLALRLVEHFILEYGRVWQSYVVGICWLLNCCNFHIVQDKNSHDTR